MKKPVLPVFLVLSFLLLAACGGDEAKRPNEDALLAEEAIGVAEGIKDAYEKKDVGAIRKFCTEEAYGEISGKIKEFEDVELEFTPRWVEVREDGTVYLNVSWSGKWTLADGVWEERGMAVFELKERPLRLGRLHRSSPFGQPEAQPKPPAPLP